jgi:hypothetical protein
MTNSKRKQWFAALWCFVAFLLGIALLSGCAATTETRASVFDRDIGAGAGFYLEGEGNVDKH